MAKRGASGLSLIVGVNKPTGMSSHDVVNRCRRIFGERRVGHTGTLDPLASGVLPICVGPATRLDAYLVGHDKEYRVRVSFGAATDTEDAAGQVTRTGEVPGKLLDERFAASYVESLVGASKQMPPAYSAIKVQGVKACDAARKGTIIDLTPRDIEVYEARFLGLGESDERGYAFWDILFRVSKGTYIRSLARDIGIALDCPAHVGALQRTRVGCLGLEECVTLETLEQEGTRAALDPIRLLGCRFTYADGALQKAVENGAPLDAAGLAVYERRHADLDAELCACTAGVCQSKRPLEDGELIAALCQNKLRGLYGYDQAKGRLEMRCVFQVGVSRG